MNECNPDNINKKPEFTQWEQESFTDDLYSAREYLHNLYLASLKFGLEQTQPELFGAVAQAFNNTQNAIDHLSNIPAVAELIRSIESQEK